MVGHVQAIGPTRRHIIQWMCARRPAEVRERKVPYRSNPLGRSGAYATLCLLANTGHALQHNDGSARRFSPSPSDAGSPAPKRETPLPSRSVGLPHPIGSMPCRHSRRLAQQRDLLAILPAAAASRQMHAHPKSLVDSQRAVERVRQQARHVLTVPQWHLRSSAPFRSDMRASACARDTAARCNDSSSASIPCKCPRCRNRGTPAS